MTNDGTKDSSLTDVPIVAVIGTMRSGTSCMAGILHNMGVCMGKVFQPHDVANPKGYFEAMGLKKIVNRHKNNRNKPEAERQLRGWANMIRHHVKTNPDKWAAAGGKLPNMCFILETLVKAWQPNMYVIRMNRPLEDVAASAKALGWLRNPRHVQRMHKALTTGLGGCDVLDIEYNDLMDNPAAEVRKIVNFLPVQFTAEQVLGGVAHVDTKLCRHRGGEK